MKLYYIAVRWELDTKKSEKKIGYTIIQLPQEFIDLIEPNSFVFNELPVYQAKVKLYKRQLTGETRQTTVREYERMKKHSKGQKILIQRQDLKKQPFIAIRFPLIWRKKHMQSFFSLFEYKHWVAFTWKTGKQILPADHELITPVAIASIPAGTFPAIVILSGTI